MDLSLNADELTVRKVFADIFAKEASIARVRAAEPLGFDADLWSALSASGAIVMGAPEDLAGGGATATDLALVAEEYGRTLAPVPFPEAASAVNALSSAGPTMAGVVEEIASGDVVPTLILRPPVDGVARLAPAGAVADLAVLLDNDQLVMLRRAGPRPYLESPANLGSQPIADWDLTAPGTERTVLAEGSHARTIHRDACSLWRTLTAAALNGLRKEALDVGVAYVKQRYAFGVPIAAFQTIQHRLQRRFDLCKVREHMGVLDSVVDRHNPAV